MYESTMNITNEQSDIDLEIAQIETHIAQIQQEKRQLIQLRSEITNTFQMNIPQAQNNQTMSMGVQKTLGVHPAMKQNK